MKVSTILKGAIDSNGHQPIQVRIYHAGKSRYHPTHIKVKPEWFKAGRVTSDHPDHRAINKKLETLIIQYQSQSLKPQEKVKKTYLFAYITTLARKWDKIKKPGTIRIYLSQLQKLKAFTPDVPLSDIDNNFLYAYQSHLIGLGNKQNTVWSSLKFLRTILNEAVKSDLLTKSPFKKFPMPKYEDPHKDYLLPDEIKRIDKFCADKNCPPDLFFVGTWFLIACETGLRLGDQRTFDRKKHIHGGRLVVKTQKKGEVIGLPISDKLTKLFERIDYKPMHYTGEAYNRLLKLVVMGAGIDKKVSTHTGRHTMAMSLANSGVSQEVTAKILGQKDLRSTAAYYKISNSRIDAELKKRK
jgi:integrase